MATILYPLTIFDSENIIPHAAESWSSNDDFTVAWTFVLHEDLTWSDGRPVTADDVKFTAEFTTDPGFSRRIENRNNSFQGLVGYARTSWKGKSVPLIQSRLLMTRLSGSP